MSDKPDNISTELPWDVFRTPASRTRLIVVSVAFALWVVFLLILAFGRGG